MYRVLVTLIPLLLLGCQTMQSQDSRYRIPVGSRLVLERDLALPPFGDFLYIQAGRAVPYRSIESVEPHCIIETRTVTERVRWLHPDTFTITDVRRDSSVIGGLGPPLVARSDDSPPTQVFYRVLMTLSSSHQSEPYRMVCQADRHLATGVQLGAYLTVTEVREALGDLFRLELAP